MTPPLARCDIIRGPPEFRDVASEEATSPGKTYILKRTPNWNRRPALIALEKWSCWPDPTRL